MPLKKGCAVHNLSFFYETTLEIQSFFGKFYTDFFLWKVALAQLCLLALAAAEAGICSGKK